MPVVVRCAREATQNRTQTETLWLNTIQCQFYGRCVQSWLRWLHFYSVFLVLYTKFQCFSMKSELTEKKNHKERNISCKCTNNMTFLYFVLFFFFPIPSLTLFSGWPRTVRGEGKEEGLVAQRGKMEGEREPYRERKQTARQWKKVEFEITHSEVGVGVKTETSMQWNRWLAPIYAVPTQTDSLTTPELWLYFHPSTFKKTKIIIKSLVYHLKKFKETSKFISWWNIVACIIKHSERW